MELRPYQSKAVKCVLEQWDAGIDKTLLILPTGTGKTIVFSKITEHVVGAGGRVLILAHRHELLQQAADKLMRATGLGCAVEKAELTALHEDNWFNVTVGSVQTLLREDRRAQFDNDHYTHIVVDEAHHTLSKSYQDVLAHWPRAKVLGVTATADRGDKRNLGEIFETIAMEYSLPAAIREGYLCRIVAQTIPLNIDLSGVKQTTGDFNAGDLGSAIDPYLGQIAQHIKEVCADRKTVVFLPLIDTSMKMLAKLLAIGVDAREVNGESKDRADVLEWFDKAGAGTVLCNAMLLTEGWDCPSVDCVCVLRPTKVRSLYCQMVGRGTRPAPGKQDLLLLDFLWHSERHELCRPAHLVCTNQDISKRVAEIMAEDTEGAAKDILEEQQKAEKTASEEREESLRKLLDEQKHRKRALVDPLQYEMSIQHQVSEFEADSNNLKDLAPPTTAQLKLLEDAGIFPDDVQSQGHASKLLDTLKKRRGEGLSTPKQIRKLESYGFQNVGTWSSEQANSMITRIAATGWRVPYGVKPQEYKPQGV